MPHSITSLWNLEKYKNKNFENFLDETIIFIMVLAMNRGSAGDYINYHKFDI
jgi:hypothetical protein